MFLFQLFVVSVQKISTRLIRHPIGSVFMDQCENFGLLRQAFQYNQIKGIPSHTDLCIKQSMCDVTNDENNADGLHQVHPAYGNFECIMCNCKKHGPDNILLEILKKNPGIEDSKELIEFNRWDWVPKPW